MNKSEQVRANGNAAKHVCLMFFGIAVIATISGCGAGGASTPVLPTGGSTVTAPLVPLSVELGTQPTVAALPVTANISGTITFPAVTTTSAVALTASAVAPAGVALQGLRRVQSSGTLTVYEYITATPKTTITLPSLPAISLTFPDSTSIVNKTFSYGFTDSNAQGGLTEGPGMIRGQTVGFSAVAKPITLLAGHPVTFIVYATLALRAATHIYVAHNGSTGANIYTYTAQGLRTTPTITYPYNRNGVDQYSLYRVAVDPVGKIYGGSLYPFASTTAQRFNADGSSSLRGSFVFHATFLVGFAVDSTGRVFARGTSDAAIATYLADGSETTPLVPNGGLASPNFGPIAIDAGGKLYTIDGNQLKCFTAKGARTTPTITIPDLGSPPYYADSANMLAVGATGKIYVETLGAVRTFNADGSAGSVTIPLAKPNLPASFSPALAVDAIGQIYVQDGSQIKTYKPDGSRTVPTIPIVGDGIAVN